MTSLSSCPTALPWDWVATFALPADARVGHLEAFLEEIGEHAFALGTVLASLESGHDYYLAFVTPTEVEQLSRLLTAHRMSAESVRYGRWTPRVSPEASALGAWATAHGHKIGAAPGAAITVRLESPGASEPDRLT